MDNIKGSRDDRGMALQSMEWKENPRKGCCLKFLRLIYKIIRMFHVQFFFYFTPFLMLFYQFYQFTDVTE